MRDDPFARMAGLDQQLFVAGRQPTITDTPKTAAPQPKQRTSTSERPSGRPADRPSGETSFETAEQPTVATSERSTGRPDVRTIERRPYDFFHDQVQWLNRMKVTIEERYHRKVTANAMVQLALDRLIEDYQRRGRDSALVAQLVRGRQSDYGTAQRLGGRTSGRPEGEE